MRKKHAFTLAELTIVMIVIPMMILSAVSLLLAASDFAYTTQVESSNIHGTYDNIYCITREIQSAEYISVSDNGKKLEVRQKGMADIDIYEIKENEAGGHLEYNNQDILYINSSQSSFRVDGRNIKITLSVISDDIIHRQNQKNIEFTVVPRSDDAVVMEVV